MTDRCENCLGMETTLGCITAAVDIPGTNIKKGMTLSEILSKGSDLFTINSVENRNTESVSNFEFNPPQIYGTSNCASQLESSMFKYKVENTNTTSNIEWNYCEILNGFPIGYDFADQSIRVVSKNGQIGASRGNIGRINVKKDDYPLTLSTTVYINTPCGQVKLTNDTVLNSCQEVSDAFSTFKAEDLSHVENITDPNEYMAQMALKVRSLENKLNSFNQNPIGCNEMLDSLNQTVDDLRSQCEVLTQQNQQLQENFNAVKLKNDTFQNQIQDNRMTIISLNNLSNNADNNEVQQS